MQTLVVLRDALTRRWRTILVVTALTTATTTLAVYIRAPSYESRAALFVNVERHRLSVARADVRTDGAALQAVESVTSHAEGLRSRILAELVVDQLDPAIFERRRPRNLVLRMMSDAVTGLRDSGADVLRWLWLMPPKNPRYDLIEKVEGGFGVATVRQSQVIRLTYRADNPETAQTVLKTLLDTYIRLNAERVIGTDILSEKALGLRPRLEAAERELGALKAEYGIVDLSGEKTMLAERIGRLMTVLEDASDTAVASVSRDARVASRATPSTTTSGGRSVLDIPDDAASGGVASAQVVQLRAQLNRHRLERAGLLETYSPDRAMVGPLDTRIENLKQQLAQEISRIRDTIAGYRARLETLLKVEPQINQASRNVTILSDTYEVYRKEADDRSIMRTQDSMEQLRMIDPPSIPYAPRGPVPALLVLAGLGLGLVFGLGAAISMNFVETALRRHKAVAGVD